MDKLQRMIGVIPKEVKLQKRVTFRPTLNFDTAKSVSHYLHTLYEKYDVRSFIIQPLIMGNVDGFVDWSIEDFNKLKDDIFSFFKSYDDIDIEVTEGVSKKTRGNTCLNDYDIISVDPTGDFSGCFFFVNQKEKAEGLMSGNIFDDIIFYEREENLKNLSMKCKVLKKNALNVIFKIIAINVQLETSIQVILYLDQMECVRSLFNFI